MIRKRDPDVALARSLVEASMKEMSYLGQLQPSPESAQTIIRGVYENFRRLGEALLALQGLEGDHEDAMKALMALPARTERPLAVLDNLRRLRHEINYRGYQPTQADLDDVLSIKTACWRPVFEEMRKRVVG